MTRKKLVLAALSLVILMLVAAWLVGFSLPAGSRLPTHWGLSGEPNQFSNKWAALLLPVGMVVAVSAIFYALPFLEPRRKGLERSQGLYLWSWAALLIVGVLTQLAVISVALRWSVHGTTFVLAGLGVLFLLIGNQLGKSRSMYMIGLRTPWTLASEEVWIKTHRLAGKLMVTAGLLIVIAAFLALPNGLIATLVATVVVAIVLIPAGYSYLIWRLELRKDITGLTSDR